MCVEAGAHSNLHGLGVPKHDSLSLLSLFSHRARRHAEVARGIAVGWARVAAVRVPSAS